MVNFVEPPPGDVPSGQELLTEFMRYGRQRPFEEIVRRYAGMVYNTCLRVTRDKHDAEDAAQAVFLTLALQVKKGTDIKALGPWLQQVAKRLSLDLRRGKKRRSGREQRHHDEQHWRRQCADADALPSADLDELKSVLQDELQRLPSKYRLPLILHYFGGLSRDELAEQLNCNTSTLGVRIFRGRALLAERLRGRGMNFNPILLPIILGSAVRGTVTQAMVAATSRAAAAVAAGHDGVGLVSKRVIRLTRRAAAAALFGKVKIAAAALLLMSTVLVAGARAVGVFPHLDIQSIVVQQVQRLVRPLLQPLSVPIQARGPWRDNPWTDPLHLGDASHHRRHAVSPALADEYQIKPFAPPALLPDWTVPPVSRFDFWAGSGVVDRDALAAASAAENPLQDSPAAKAESADGATDGDAADPAAANPAMADVDDRDTDSGAGGGGGGGGGAFSLVPDRPAAVSASDSAGNAAPFDSSWGLGPLGSSTTHSSAVRGDGTSSTMHTASSAKSDAGPQLTTDGSGDAASTPGGDSDSTAGSSAGPASAPVAPAGGAAGGNASAPAPAKGDSHSASTGGSRSPSRIGPSQADGSTAHVVACGGLPRMALVDADADAGRQPTPAGHAISAAQAVAVTELEGSDLRPTLASLIVPPPNATWMTQVILDRSADGSLQFATADSSGDGLVAHPAALLVAADEQGRAAGSDADPTDASTAWFTASLDHGWTPLEATLAEWDSSDFTALPLADASTPSGTAQMWTPDAHRSELAAEASLVAVDAPTVPEPSSLAMLAIGATLLLRRKGRRPSDSLPDHPF